MMRRELIIMLLVLLHGPEGNTAAAAAGFEDEHSPEGDTAAAAAGLEDEHSPAGDTAAATAGLEDEQRGGPASSSGTPQHLDDGHNDQQDGTKAASDTISLNSGTQRLPEWSAPSTYTSQSQVSVQPIHTWHSNLYMSQAPLPYTSVLLPLPGTALISTTITLPLASLQPQTIPASSSPLLNVDDMQEKIILIPDSFSFPFLRDQLPAHHNTQLIQPLVGLVPQKLLSSGESTAVSSSFGITQDDMQAALQKKLLEAPYEASLEGLQGLPWESLQEAPLEAEQKAPQELQEVQQMSQDALQETHPEELEVLQETQMESSLPPESFMPSGDSVQLRAILYPGRSARPKTKSSHTNIVYPNRSSTSSSDRIVIPSETRPPPVKRPIRPPADPSIPIIFPSSTSNFTVTTPSPPGAGVTDTKISIFIPHHCIPPCARLPF